MRPNLANRLFRTLYANGQRVHQVRRQSSTSTPLEHILLQSIKATGPISVANYMQFCLAHPVHGYYMKGDPFGVSGDFITSPEITQMFGELIAIWFISALESTFHGSSQRPNLRLVELGPGRGTLTGDILRIMTGPLAKRTGLGLTSVHLVETSDALRKKQQATLANYLESPISISWHTDIDEIPRQTGEWTLLIANELFDALPIHIFEKANDGWQEVLVDAELSTGVTVQTQSQDGELAPAQRLRFVRSREAIPLPAITSNPRFSSLPIGSRIEYSRGSVKIMKSIAKLLGGGGLGLVIDYGAEHAFSSSFRGVRRHSIVGPFTTPGDCDLTANVDFATLKEAVRDTPEVQVLGPISQRTFLLKMGLEARIAGLMRSAVDDERRRTIQQAGLRLVDGSLQGMGKTFQVMGLNVSSDSCNTVVYPF